MKIAITGSSGLVGSALMPLLVAGGYDIVRLRRPGDWDPEQRTVNLSALSGVDAVINLAGESIASGLWTTAKKRRILDSRVKSTRFISETISRMDPPPQVLVSASAIGYYGDRGDEVLTEESAPGNGFLAEVCRQWEAATDPATRRGIRVVHPRIGLVLSAKGGALGKMLLPFKLGLGGRIGSGSQFWSWISIDDLCGAIVHCIQAPGLHGPVNIVSPTPITNADFTKVLGRVLRRLTILPMPAFAARMALGEMADALLLASARVEPTKLVASRFVFRHKELESTLKHVLS
ncbi:MAG TPA: TIGR01777 family oxidoreductase [Pyrinomonadaceae bacterium]|nr:TIGR01777 family oxidoreductase [Pyrinomonadaceae bacterium]